MVFSQTSHKTHSVLKVVEIDRLKPEKNQQVNGSTGVIAGGNTGFMPPSPSVATTSYSEVYLKPEPVFESTMFHDSDFEFFQDLVPLCSDLAKEEQVPTIDSPKKTEESAYNTDTLHTPFSPQGWDVLDANSPAPAALYVSTPNDPLSPNMDGFSQLDNKFLYSTDIENETKLRSQELDFDISSLPVVIGDLASERMVDLNPAYVVEPVDYHNTHDTVYTPTNTHNKLFFDLEDMDMKLDSVMPREVENNNVVMSKCIMNEDWGTGGLLEKPRTERREMGLSLNVTMPVPWSLNNISTPEVLNYVEELEKEKYTPPMTNPPEQTLLQDSGFISTDTCMKILPSPADYEPITPKSESHLESDVDDSKSHSSRRRRRHDSEDSDETYTPHVDYTPRKYKRRKPNIPIKDMIMALEGSQQLPKARRGRPPKRRESTVSSVCSIDDNTSSVSTHEVKYRELRDKNNEASKRSRMNRKLKELQMEQHADDLEERNKKLKVRADILEDMTKRLKDALMTAILQK